jgi:hypothetical protein
LPVLRQICSGGLEDLSLLWPKPVIGCENTQILAKGRAVLSFREFDVRNVRWWFIFEGLSRYDCSR